MLLNDDRGVDRVLCSASAGGGAPVSFAECGFDELPPAAREALAVALATGTQVDLESKGSSGATRTVVVPLTIAQRPLGAMEVRLGCGNDRAARDSESL